MLPTSCQKCWNQVNGRWLPSRIVTLYRACCLCSCVPRCRDKKGTLVVWSLLAAPANGPWSDDGRQGGQFCNLGVFMHAECGRRKEGRGAVAVSSFEEEEEQRHVDMREEGEGTHILTSMGQSLLRSKNDLYMVW